MTIPASTSNYPTSLDTDVTLFKSHDRRSFTLAAGISNTSLAMNINEDCTGLTGNFFLAFQTGELIFVSGISNKTMTIVRGVSGTSPAEHLSGEPLKLVLSANILEQLKKAIIAVETALGVSPAGSSASVAARLAIIEGLAASHNHTGGSNGPLINADTVDGFHAAATATANKLLALDSSGNLPASITGDAPTLGGNLPSAFCKVGAANLKAGSAQAIATYTVTVNTTVQSHYIVDTQGGASADLLQSLIGTMAAGDVIALRATASTRTIQVVSGGNIVVPSYPVYLSSVFDTLFRTDGTNWYIVGATGADHPQSQYCVASRSTNAAASATAADILFNAEDDTWGWHAAGAAGIAPVVAGTYVASTWIKFSTATAGYWYGAEIHKGGSTILAADNKYYSGDVFGYFNLVSKPIALAPGDLITAYYIPGASSNVYANSWLALQRIR